MSHQTSIQKLLNTLDALKPTYSKVLVSSYLYNDNGTFVNTVSIFTPLCKDELIPPDQTLDYGNYILCKSIISFENLREIVASLPEGKSFNIKIGEKELQVNGNALGDYWKFNSGVKFFTTGWAFEKYQYRNPQPKVDNEPLVAVDLPLFPDYRSCIREFIGVDPDRYSDAYGLIFCLPHYGARIHELNVSPNALKVSIETKTEIASNIIGKLYCINEQKSVFQKDFGFADNTSTINLGFKPEYIHVLLLSKNTGQILDERQFGFGWDLPRGVIIDIPEYELQEMIRNGETQTVEFKEKIGEPTEFAETVVAFANQQGGVIIIGVNDKTSIVGLDSRDSHKDTITNIISSHCEPRIKYTIEERVLNEKRLLLVKVMEGNDKPYMLRERGAYIRANGTDRVVTRFELDEFYNSRKNNWDRRTSVL